MALTEQQRAALLGSAPDFLVIGFCAAWCGTCRDFASTFADLQARHPERCLIWLDIEDDSDLAGDIEIDNFPSLAVFRKGEPVFFGVTEPQQAVIERLLDGLGQAAATPVPAAVLQLHRDLTGIGPLAK